MFQSSLLLLPSGFKKLTVKMEAVSSCEASVTTYQSTQCLIQEDMNFQPCNSCVWASVEEWNDRDHFCAWSHSSQAPYVTVLSLAILGHKMLVACQTGCIDIVHWWKVWNNFHCLPIFKNCHFLWVWQFSVAQPALCISFTMGKDTMADGSPWY